MIICYIAFFLKNVFIKLLAILHNWDYFVSFIFFIGLVVLWYIFSFASDHSKSSVIDGTSQSRSRKYHKFTGPACQSAAAIPLFPTEPSEPKPTCDTSEVYYDAVWFGS